VTDPGPDKGLVILYYPVQPDGGPEQGAPILAMNERGAYVCGDEDIWHDIPGLEPDNHPVPHHGLLAWECWFKNVEDPFWGTICGEWRQLTDEERAALESGTLHELVGK